MTFHIAAQIYPAQESKICPELSVPLTDEHRGGVCTQSLEALSAKIQPVTVVCLLAVKSSTSPRGAGLCSPQHVFQCACAFVAPYAWHPTHHGRVQAPFSPD